MYSFKELVQFDSENIDDLVAYTSENGKPLKESKAEIIMPLYRLLSEEGKRTYGRTIPATQTDKRIITIKHL